MLGIRISLLIVVIAAFVVARLISEERTCDDNLVETFDYLFISKEENDAFRKDRIASFIFTVIGFISIIAFSIVLIITNWTFFAIPKILLLIAISLLICLKEELRPCWVFGIAFIITIISFIVSGVLWFDNLKKPEKPDIETTKTIIMCAKDNSNINGTMSGGIFYVSGSVEEDPVYRYYYKLEDGGIKQGEIPAESTTIYYIEENKDPYLEKILTTNYLIDDSKNPPKHVLKNSKTTYKLYVPEGAVTNVFEFNADY